MKKNEKIALKRDLEKPIKIFGKHLKIARVMLILMVFLLYLATLYYEIKATNILYFSIIPFVLLIYSILLLKKELYILENIVLSVQKQGIFTSLN